MRNFTTEDLAFLRRTVSGDFAKHYDPLRQAAGLYAITNRMVEEFGVPAGATYHADLPAVADAGGAPYADFRYDLTAAHNFILGCSKDMTVSYPALGMYVAVLTPYCGATKIQAALDSLTPTDLNNAGNDPLFLMVIFASRVAREVKGDNYLTVLVNLLRHNMLGSTAS